MKRVLLMLVAMFVLVACDGQTAEQKIQAQVKDKVHALTADERPVRWRMPRRFLRKSFR